MTHDTTGLSCWCSPTIQRQCPECDGEADTCWRCGGTGSVQVSIEEARVADEALVVVHYESDDPDDLGPLVRFEDGERAVYRATGTDCRRGE